MNKVSLVLVNAVALVLVGCGSGGSGGSTAGSTEGSSASAGSTASASAGLSTIGTSVGSTVGDTAAASGMTAAGTTDTATAGTEPTSDTTVATTGIDATAGSTVGETAGDTAITAGSTTEGSTAGSATNGGAGSQGDNPGMVPDPIIGEASSIDLSTFAGPAGYKIYSGDEIDPALPLDFSEFVENRFINLEFPCSGEVGNIEVFPRGFLDFEAEDPYGGTFSWEPADPEDEFGSVDLAIATIAYGEPTNVGLPFTIDNVVNGSLIVGSGLFEDLIVTRIVQFDACN